MDAEYCSFPYWYKKLSRHTVESIILPIPNDVFKYLQEDGVVLPLEAENHVRHTGLDIESTVEWDEAEEDTLEIVQPTFPGFTSCLKDAINNLGGEVFVKLNWSAPKDSAWIMTNNSLKCSSVADVYMLLKSSSVLAKDLSFKFTDGLSPTSEKHCVVLKRWINVHPGCEFRCFVVKNKLVGICQRDYTSFYEYIKREKYDILEGIKSFFHKRLENVIPIENFIFDVIREEDGDIVLLDIGTLTTSSVKTSLFTMKELQDLAVDRITGSNSDIVCERLCNSESSVDDGPTVIPEFRYLGEDPGIHSNHCKEHYGFPKEVSTLCEHQNHPSVIDFIVNEQRNEEYQ